MQVGTVWLGRSWESGWEESQHCNALSCVFTLRCSYLSCILICINVIGYTYVLCTMHSCFPATKPRALCSAHTSMHTCKYALHKHAQMTIEQNWWKNRGVALLCALLSPHSRQHPPSHQCLDFHTLSVISHTHNMQVSTPLLQHTDKMCQHSMGHQVDTCQHNHPPIWSFAKWQI